MKQWAERSIVCPQDYGDKKAVDNACGLVGSRLKELRKYKNKGINNNP